MLTVQNYVRPQTLEEAWELNQKKKNRIIGGMLWLRLRNDTINTAIDLSALGLDTIEETEDAFSIGAMVTLRQIECHWGLNHYTGGAASAAVRDIVGVQFRNMATVGGSIWGRFGFSDVLTLFSALDTEVELYRGGRIPLSEFVNRPCDRDILVRLIVHKTPGHVVYCAMRNQRTDFPTLACAVSDIGGTHRAVIGARPTKAVILSDENGHLANGITAESANAFAEEIASRVTTASNLRASAEYRTHLIRVLTARAVRKLGTLGGDCT